MITLTGLEGRHEHLVSGRELLRQADRHLNGAMDSACGPWLNRRAVDALVDDLFRKYADDAGKVECVGFARVLAQRALAQQEQAVAKAQADIFAETDPDNIRKAEAGHLALTARLQKQAESRAPDKEESDAH